MNITITPTISPNSKPPYNDALIFLIIAIIFFGTLCFVIVKYIFNCSNHRIIEPQIAVLIEIPIAVSISTQTVDNEHIGTVI